MLQILPRNAFPAEEGQVEFHLTPQRFFGLLQRSSNEMDHAPRGLVRDFQISLNRCRRKSALGVREHHEHVEPESERDLGLLKDGARSGGDLTRTAGAMVLPPVFDTLESSTALTRS